MTDSGASASVDTGQNQWFEEMIRAMFRLLHHYEQGNFDAARYLREVQPNVFFPDKHAAYFLFLLKYCDEFFRARALLADKASRDLYDQLLLFRLLGHMHVRLPFNNDETKTYDEIANSWRLHETNDGGAFGKLSIFQIPVMGQDIRVKCWRENVAATFLTRQYYLNRDGSNVEPVPGDYIVDAGGCFGDTALGFAATAGESGHVYTFDPMPKHCAIIRENLAMNPALASRISVFELGLSATARTGRGFSGVEGTINPGATAFDDAISTTTLDKMADDGTLARVNFIKMDVEGSELDALRGAECVIRKHRPRLAISLYHRPEDFFTIPLWLDQLSCGYRFHLDHYSIHHEETVLYAAV